MLRKKRWILPVLLVIILPQFTSGCFSFRMNQKELKKHFDSRNVKYESKKFIQGERTINYVSTGSDTLPHIIFYHGAPGSLSAFIDFLSDTSLLKHTRLISTDRPGYGFSNFGKSVVSLKEQSELLKPLLELNKTGKPTILVGHSLGAPLIAQIAMDYPELVDGLIMVGSSIDPDLEPNERWFRAPLYTPFFRWLLPISFRVTNDEIYFLEDQLREMEENDDWSKIVCPVILIHGGEDRLVPVGNVAFALKVLDHNPPDTIIIDDMDHFVPWSHPKLINRAIFKILGK